MVVFGMEAHFRHKKKKVIANFYLTILTFFTELWDINSHLRCIKSALWDINSQFWLFLLELCDINLQLRVKGLRGGERLMCSQNCEFISHKHNSEKKSQNYEIESQLPFTFFLLYSFILLYLNRWEFWTNSNFFIIYSLSFEWWQNYFGELSS